MNLSEWHDRFREQASWTFESRKFILSKINLPRNPRQIEIGCGTGIILEQTTFLTDSKSYGLDINWNHINFCKNYYTSQQLILADGNRIPISSGYFDLVYCHFLLLWIKDPIIMLNEMKRITKTGGWVCCFAEPDYLGRIDFPFEIQQLGQKQNLGLLEQGVGLDTGRRLTFWMEKAGFTEIHWGIIGSHQSLSKTKNNFSQEWKITKNDLSFIFPERKTQNDEEQYLKNNSIDTAISFIPTFYAYAQV